MRFHMRGEVPETLFSVPGAQQNLRFQHRFLLRLACSFLLNSIVNPENFLIIWQYTPMVISFASAWEVYCTAFTAKQPGSDRITEVAPRVGERAQVAYSVRSATIGSSFAPWRAG